jgi:hypothetical protein
MPDPLGQNIGREMTKTERIQQLVRNFIQDNSGGAKYTEVLTHIFYAMHASAVEEKDTSLNKDTSLDDIESVIRSMPDIKVLDYGWQMDKDLWREKMFVYTPLPQSNGANIRPDPPVWKGKWYSICSIHKEYRSNCDICNVGRWISDDETI